MTLAEQITDYVNAAFSGLYVHTQEPDEAVVTAAGKKA